MRFSKKSSGGAMNRVEENRSNKKTHRIPPFALTALLLSVVFTSAYLGSSLPGYLGFAVIISALAVTVAFSRSILCFAFTAVSAFVIFSYTGNIYFSLIFCAIVTAVGVGAFLIKSLRSPLLFLLLPLSYILAIVCGGSPLRALLSLSVYPAMAALAFFTKGNSGRISTVCRVSAVIFITASAALITYIVITEGSLRLSSVFRAVDRLFDRLTAHYIYQYASVAENYRELGLAIPTPDDAKVYAKYVYGILPAISIFVINIISFISHQIQVSLLDRSGNRKDLTKLSLSFTMSWASALVFIAAYLVMLALTYQKSSYAALIAENIYIILLPGLVFTGFLILLGRREGGRRHSLWLTVIIILLFVSPNIALISVAFIGCSVIISSALRQLFSKISKS